MWSDVLCICGVFLGCFIPFWIAKSVIFGPKNLIFWPFLTINIEQMAVKMSQTSPNIWEKVKLIPKIIFNYVWEVCDSVWDIYRQLLATKSDFFWPHIHFLDLFWPQIVDLWRQKFVKRPSSRVRNISLCFWCLQWRSYELQTLRGPRRTHNLRAPQERSRPAQTTIDP